jgi:hypothetical protein
MLSGSGILSIPPNPSRQHYLDGICSMTSAVTFGDANSGFQAGTINGPVRAEFHHHHPPGLL